MAIGGPYKLLRDKGEVVRFGCSTSCAQPPVRRTMALRSAKNPCCQTGPAPDGC